MTSTTTKIIIVFAFIFWIAAGYYYGNILGNQSGYMRGKAEGYLLGQDFGFKSGFTNGTKAGYNQGYPVGFAAGDLAGYGRGYSVGFDEGKAKGYSLGYTVGETTGNADGYKLGYAAGYKATGFNIKDPTYNEMLAFIETDKTNENLYVDIPYVHLGAQEMYVCHDFAFDVKRNAFSAGYRCFYVSIEWGEYTTIAGHAIVAFNTTNRGIVFVEPQKDEIVYPRVGYPYFDRTIYLAPSFDDTITKIELVP